MPKRGTWLSWLKKQCIGANDPHSEVHPYQNTEPAMAPDEAEASLDKTGNEEELKLSREETNSEVKEEGDTEKD